MQEDQYRGRNSTRDPTFVGPNDRGTQRSGDPSADGRLTKPLSAACSWAGARALRISGIEVPTNHAICYFNLFVCLPLLQIACALLVCWPGFYLYKILNLICPGKTVVENLDSPLFLLFLIFLSRAFPNLTAQNFLAPCRWMSYDFIRFRGSYWMGIKRKALLFSLGAFGSEG